MKALIVGSGGREHALVWKLSRERAVREVICAPGNAGIAAIARCAPVAATDLDGLVALARAEHIDLTVVGPEAPLERGLVDRFDAEGLPAFGPTRHAARLETSKAFAKDVMQRAQVPTARYRVASTPDAARAAAAEFGGRVALKADGLAAGKGVIVADSLSAANDAIDALMVQRKVGDAASTLVVEERLDGPEVSFFVLCDGAHALPLGSAQDHKRVNDGDEGPNTGGMGAFAPSPLMDDALQARVMQSIVLPVLRTMAADGHPYRGFLYVGLMLTANGPKVIEFNVRFGDPEAQVVLPMIEDDLAPILLAAASGGNLADITGGAGSAGAFRMRRDPHVGVVLASRGYPEHVDAGKIITGLADAASLDDVLIFHAGTTLRDREIVSSGGRVLTVVGRGATFESAIARAYDAVGRIDFDGMHVRRDIGQKALHQPNASGVVRS
jgi:phosphoribosylamine---glycine ligase